MKCASSIGRRGGGLIGIDLELRGVLAKRGFFSRAPSADKVLQAAKEEVIRESKGLLLTEPVVHADPETGALAFLLHPGAPPAALTIRPGEVMFMARTSSAGPGYHQFLCDLLQKVADAAGIEWKASNEPTGYFLNRDERALRQAFLDWLQQMMAWFLREKDPDAGMLLSMDQKYIFLHPGFLLTVAGPLDRRWAEEISTEPWKGETVFPWWKRDMDARHWLGRALCLMWTEVRWRRPESDAERRALEAANDALSRARSLDHSLPVPWREWNEILALLGRNSPDVAAAAARDAVSATVPPAGYRRGRMIWRFTEVWSIKVPAWIVEENEEDSSHAFDGRLTYHLTAYSRREEVGPAPPPEQVVDRFLSHVPGPGDVVAHRGKGVVGKARFRETLEDGKTIWVLQGATASNLGACTSTIAMSSPEDRPAAEEAWRSIECAEWKEGQC